MDFPSFALDGKVALVTGASKGIGYDLARAIANTGATVIVLARNLDSLHELVDVIQSERNQAFAIRLDMSDVAQIRSVVNSVINRYGQIDILVNNAGLGFNHDAVDVNESDWDDMMNVNLKGLFFMCQAVGQHMIAQNDGRIINISSQAGQVGILRHAVYCATKGGVNQLTRVLALEWAQHNVTVNAVAPTFIRTPGTAERLDTPEFSADVLSRLPIGRVGTTMDVAGAVIYLASSAASLVTGTILLVDSGWTAV